MLINSRMCGVSVFNSHYARICGGVSVQQSVCWDMWGYWRSTFIMLGYVGVLVFNTQYAGI